MASKTSIFNRALTKLGDTRVLSPTDDSKPARTLNSMYDDVRDAEIRRHRWKFAVKRASLPALADAPAFGYQYQYPLPPDYLSLIQLGEMYLRSTRKGLAPWSVEAGNILTNMPAPLLIRYVSRVENASLFDPLFVEVLACKLAFEACETLTQSNTKKQSAWDEYKYALNEAVRQDAIENPPDELPDGTWLESRELDGLYPSTGVTGWKAFPGGF